MKLSKKPKHFAPRAGKRLKNKTMPNGRRAARPTGVPAVVTY